MWCLWSDAVQITCLVGYSVTENPLILTRSMWITGKENHRHGAISLRKAVDNIGKQKNKVTGK